MNDPLRLGIGGITLVCCLCVVGVVVLAATGHDTSPAVTMLAGLAITTGGGLAGYLVRVLQQRERDRPDAERVPGGEDKKTG